jgi:hypothetical protein
MGKVSNTQILNMYDRVSLTSFTWDRECHGLYDFDLKSVEKVENKFVGCGYVQRNLNKIKIEHPGLAVDKDKKDEIENLVSLVYQHNTYWLFHNQSIEKDSYKNHI